VKVFMPQRTHYVKQKINFFVMLQTGGDDVILEESLACGRAGFFQSSTVLDNKKDASS
jgi:hypothetical protein